jgi:endogenous inhibitor of DNA gyrase (YacG/DUF329 family)
MEHQCPICGKATNSRRDPDFPFCGERCRLLDLGKWASGAYVITEPALEEPAGTSSENGRLNSNSKPRPDSDRGSREE